MIEFLPLVLTGLGLTASITYYASVLRNQTRTRQAQLFMNIHKEKLTKTGLDAQYWLVNTPPSFENPEQWMRACAQILHSL